MGLWSGIKYALNSSLGTAKFEPLDVTLGKKTDAAGVTADSSMFGWVKNISGNTERGVIKSIQRGTFSGNGNTSETTRTITISPINLQKSTLNIIAEHATSAGPTSPTYKDGFIYLASSSTIRQNPYVSSTSTHYFTAFTWEVVEFY